MKVITLIGVWWYFFLLHFFLLHVFSLSFSVLLLLFEDLLIREETTKDENMIDCHVLFAIFLFFFLLLILFARLQLGKKWPVFLIKKNAKFMPISFLLYGVNWSVMFLSRVVPLKSKYYGTEHFLWMKEGEREREKESIE